MEPLSDDLLDNFERLTGYDVRAFLNSFLSFSDSDYPAINNFYVGTSDVLPTVALTHLTSLIAEYGRLNDVIQLNATLLEAYQYWVLTEYLDTISHSLESTQRLSRWARSAPTKSGYRKQVISDYMLGQGETLQDVNRKVLGSNDPDGWVDVALQNGLAEDDYTLLGGTLIKVIFQNNTSFVLNSVVDNVDSQDKVYGTDVRATIGFDEDTEDLVVLSPANTNLQSIEILSSLQKGDDPSIPQDGMVLKGTVLGGNIAGVAFPALFRDLAANFATDDSFKAIGITDVRRDADVTYLDITVQPKSGDLKKSSITV